MHPEQRDQIKKNMTHHMPLSDEPLQCDLLPVIEKMNQAHDLAVRLRALLLQTLPAGSSAAELIRQIPHELVKRLASSLLFLHSTQSRRSTGENENNAAAREKRKINYCEGSGRGMMLNGGHKRKRKMQNSWTKISSIPFEDGYLWRKYGQKDISGAKYPRNYYRCIYSGDQGCQARKTVQQEDEDEVPPKFTVAYSMQHACRSTSSGNINAIPFVMESGLASLQSFPHPSSVSSNTVYKKCNNSNSSNTTSGFSSHDGETAHQLLSEMFEQQEVVPLGSPANGFEPIDDEFGLLLEEYFCWPTDTGKPTTTGSLYL